MHDGERDKLAEYTTNRSFPNDCFVALCCDIRGSWSPSMKRYFREMQQHARAASGDRHFQELRYAKEIISRTLVMCQDVYLHAMRFGLVNVNQKEKNAERASKKTKQNDASEDQEELMQDVHVVTPPQRKLNLAQRPMTV